MEPNGGPNIAVAINLVCLNMDLRLKKEFSQIIKHQTNEIEVKKVVKLIFDTGVSRRPHGIYR
jgi:hypothetical protein